MKGIFRPSVNLINRLRYRQKLMLLGAIILIIVFFLLYEISEQALTNINHAKQELVGLKINVPLFNLMRKLEDYRSLKNKFLNNLATSQELHVARINVDDSIIQVADAIEDESYANILMENFEQIKNEWALIKLLRENQVAFGQTTNIIPNLQKLIVKNCDASKLTIDPDIEAYYLIDIQCTLLPRFMEGSTVMEDIGVVSLKTKNISESDLNYIFVISTLTTRYSLPFIHDNLDKAISYQPNLTFRIANVKNALTKDTETALNTLNNTIILKNFDYPISEFNKLFDFIQVDADNMSNQLTEIIKELINTRINKYKEILIINLTVAIFGLLIFVYLFIGIYLSIIQSIRKLVKGSEEIAKGNLEAKVDLESEDELSQVADSFNIMREILLNIVSELHSVVKAVGHGNLEQRVALNNKEGFAKELSLNINAMTDVFQDIIKDMMIVLNNLSKGNLTIRVTREYEGIFAELKSYINDTIDNLENLIKSIKNSTETIRNAVQEISIGNLDLEKRTEQQAASLEQTSISMKKITETVKNNAENAKEAHTFVQTTSNNALESGIVVNQVVSMMNAISESAKQITEITEVIDNIAFQTNMLALNAAVEAARAGEQGKGFSVVASEIRNLAQRSQVSAQDIKSLINASFEQVSQGKMLADESGKSMKKVVESIQDITTTMSEIVDASVHQTDRIKQIEIAIDQMDLVTQQNSALVEEATRTSEALKKQTDHMRFLVNVFKISTDQKNAKRKYLEITEEDLQHSSIQDDEQKINDKLTNEYNNQQKQSDDSKQMFENLKDINKKSQDNTQVDNDKTLDNQGGTQNHDLKLNPKNNSKPLEENPDEWTKF